MNLSRPHPTPDRIDRPDRGSTLIELIVVIVVVGLIATVITAGITVIFRNESGVASIVTEAHDRQQAVNYFPGDIQAGPTDPAGYLTEAGTGRGSGCASSGDENILRIDQGSTIVAYRIVDDDPEDETARLDRYVCTASGAEVTVLNIADRLSVDGVTQPAVARIGVKAVPAGVVEVERVTLVLAQPSGSAEFSASPRAEAELPPAVAAGECTSDPMDETLQFATFVRGDVRFTGGPQIKWASAIGGDLSFTGGVSVGQNLNNDTDLPTIDPVGTALYIARVDWATSSGSLTIHANRDIVIDDRSNTTVTSNGARAYRLGGPTQPEIVANGQSEIVPIVEVVDFDNAFSVLRACSVALARLPGGACDDCAAHLEILDQNGNPLTNGYVPGSNMKLRLVPGKVNVLNITAAEFAAMGNMSFQGPAPSTTTPLIVNVVDAGDVVVSRYPGQGGIGSWVRSTLWNFPNASSVRLESGSDGVWGTVFAPAAHVISSVKIEGGVVAARWTHDSREVNGDRVFTGQIDWDS